MANILLFQFEADNRKLLIGKNKFGIIDYDGLGASDYEVVTEKRGNGKGERITAKRILKRIITLEFEYKEKKNKEEIREQLLSFFSPEKTGKLTVIRNSIERSVEYEVSKFRTKDINVHERLRCLLELTCVDPYFKGETVTELLTTLVGGWKWKFTLPFKLKQYGLLDKTITNHGTSETPVEITFKGPALNPKIINDRTGEYIAITKELDKNAELYINTEYGSKTVEIHSEGEVEDGWDYLDLGSSFFWLQPGENRIRYESVGETLKSQGAILRYKERYFGI